MGFQLHAGAVRRFSRAMRVGAWLQGLSQRLTPPPWRLVQMGSAFWQSRALYVAARLDIAGVLGADTLPAPEIAARVACDPGAVARLLRFLSALGVFHEAGAGCYRNNTVSEHLRDGHPQSVRAMVLMHNSNTMSRPWQEALEAGIRQGEVPFVLAHGAPLFAHLDRHPAFDSLFSQAMDCVEALAGDGFATDFDWGRFERIIDMGGSRGSKSLAILRRHPHLQALVVDRPLVVDQARAHWARHPAEGSERLEFAAGDVLEGAPEARSSRDVYLLSAVLHALDDDTATRALRHLAQACAAAGAHIAVLEAVLPGTGASAALAAFDMQMLMGSHGRERTEREWCALFERAGLCRVELVRLRSLACIQVLQASRP